MVKPRRATGYDITESLIFVRARLTGTLKNEVENMNPWAMIVRAGAGFGVIAATVPEEGSGAILDDLGKRSTTGHDCG